MKMLFEIVKDRFRYHIKPTSCQKITQPLLISVHFEISRWIFWQKVGFNIDLVSEIVFRMTFFGILERACDYSKKDSNILLIFTFV